MGEYFARISKKFDVLFEKRSYVHWYTREGMAEAEFVEAREHIAALEMDYKDIEQDECDGEDEEMY